MYANLNKLAAEENNSNKLLVICKGNVAVFLFLRRKGNDIVQFSLP
jgi:hypothetical protein